MKTKTVITRAAAALSLLLGVCSTAPTNPSQIQARRAPIPAPEKFCLYLVPDKNLLNQARDQKAGYVSCIADPDPLL